MTEKTIPFGMAPWKLFASKSSRIDCSFLKAEGWKYHWEWPYGEEKWQDRMDFFENDNICVVSCDAFCHVVDERKKESVSHLFRSVDQLKIILEMLKERHYKDSIILS